MSIEELELLQTALHNLISHANVRSSSSSGPAAEL
jgi:hypothetical protein